MDRGVQQYGPQMEKFYYGMMQGGGRQDATQLIEDMMRQGQMQDRQTRADVMSSQLPQGTAQTRALAGELGKNRLDRNIAIQQLEQDLMNQAMQRQFQGAQGLQGSQQYYEGPSSIELAMLGARQPYDLANLEARTQQQQALDQMMTQLGMYQPERQTYASPWEQFVNPFINLAGNAAMAATMGGG